VVAEVQTRTGDDVDDRPGDEHLSAGGRALASKSFIERLDRADADGLGIKTGHTTYTSLADLATGPTRHDVTPPRSPSARSRPTRHICRSKRDFRIGRDAPVGGHAHAASDRPE